MNPTATIHSLNTLFENQRQAFSQNPMPTASQRRLNLQRLIEALLDNTDRLCAAVSSDFGNRSPYETRVLEIFTSIEGIKHAKCHLKRWMKPERRPVSLWFQPASARVMYQPLGVIGVIVPWNYPLYLALGPLTTALAAGNRAMLKMSEFTPNTGQVLQDILANVFPQEEVAVINGDVSVGQAFASLPFDHLLFTGSTMVGSKVMQAASVNLTPVTLELGGKSPVVIGTEADLKLAVDRIIAGKLLNAGQTCVAPDYVLLPSGQIPSFIELAKKAVSHLYPTLQGNADYTTIINARQYQRLQNYLTDAKAKGATVEQVIPVGEQLNESNRKFPPTFVFNTTSTLLVMQEEIFGPILPLVEYQTLDEAIQFINHRPRPLALYYFGESKTQIKHVLENTISGGVTINNTVLHVVQDDLPFGGVGSSGMGHYHGREGFETFSKKKPIFQQGKIVGSSLLHPPYNKLTDWMLKLMLRR